MVAGLLTSSRYELTAYTPNESTVLLLPKLYKNPSSQRAIIALHGRGSANVGLAVEWAPGWVGGDHAQYLAHRGYAVFSIEAGGGGTWNNNTAMTSITAAYNYLIARGMSSSKIGLMGWSMGGGNALQWLKQNPTKVSAAMLWAPMSDLPYFYADSSYTAEIEAAYGGNYATNSVGHRISDEYPSWRDLCSIKLAHGDADTTVPHSQSVNFVNGVNQSQVTLTTIPGGTHTNLFSGIPVTDTFAFFEAGSW